LVTLLLLCVLGAAIGVGTVSTQESDEDIELIDLDEGLEDDVDDGEDFDESFEDDGEVEKTSLDQSGGNVVARFVPMQPTGIPMTYAILSVFMTLSGLALAKFDI
jgi:hypothetical protein